MAVSGVLALTLSAAAVAVPAPYIIEAPGPTFNTIGEANSEPLIEVTGRESFEPAGELDLTTVYVSGGPRSPISIFDAFRAWIDPSRDVLPEELVYPPGTTQDQISEQNTAAMDSSQESAVAAALRYLEIPFGESLTVAELAEDSPSKGLLKSGDVITAIDGTGVETIDVLRAGLNDARGKDVDLTIVRQGAEETVSVTPRRTESGDFQLGVLLRSAFDFPFEVKIALDNVGGPSAGSMFAVGIVDKLVPGDLTGGRHFAGTGTIDSSGDIGPIGGIGQKMAGARAQGAEFFLAPAENCGEVRGKIPDGLTVVKVATLEDAVAAVETLGSGGKASSLPTCG